VSVSESVTVGVGNTVSDAIRRFLQLSDGRLPVRINVELDEQEQVACQNTASQQGSCLSASAVSQVRRLPVGRRISRVGCKSHKRLLGLINRPVVLTTEVDREEIDDELADLHGGQVLLPLYHLSCQRQRHSLVTPNRDTPKSSCHQRLRSSSNLSRPNADQRLRPAVKQAKLSLTHANVNSEVEGDHHPGLSRDIGHQRACSKTGRNADVQY
jgi:hypothetical protein